MSLEFLQEITLELNSNTAYTTVGAKQGDSGSRVIKVHITENGQPWTIEPGVSASYRVRKPDGYSIWNSATIPTPNPENVLYLTLSEQTLAAAGRAYADILFTEGTGETAHVLSTVSFIIIIMAAPDITKNVASSNEFSQILSIVSDADAVLDEAEAWAAGTKKSVPIAADDIDLENNGTFTCAINETKFRSVVGTTPGYTRQFTFVCEGIPTGSIVPSWTLHYPNGETIVVTDIYEQYGITITGTPLQSNYIRVIVTDSDVQYHNNAKYYSDEIKNLTVTAHAVAPGEAPSISKDSSGTYLTFDFGIPSGLTGATGVQEVIVSATQSKKAPDTGNLTADDPPWVESSLSSEQVLTLTFGLPPGHDGQGAVSSVDSIGSNDGNVLLGAVRYAATQSLDDTQKNQARLNIGAAASVDGVANSSGNVALSAVRYVEQALSTAQQAQARTNINAQVIDDYIVSPSSKASNQYLKYDGSSWVAASVYAIPSGGSLGQVLKKGPQIAYGWSDAHEVPSGGSSGMVLMKNSNTNYDYTWTAIVTTAITSSEIDEIVGGS